MRDKRSEPGLPVELKDGLRRVRARLRETGALMVEKAPVAPARDGNLRPMIGELARSVDRFLGRTEENVVRVIRPRRSLPNPDFQPALVKVFLQQTASEQLQRSFERQLRSWLAAALRSLGFEDPIVLEKPLRQALILQDSSKETPAATIIAALSCQLAKTPVWRRSRTYVKREEKAWETAVAMVALALLATANRVSNAPLAAQPLLDAAHRLVEADDPQPQTQQFADWLSSKAKML
jgi:hypothetical protein